MLTQTRVSLSVSPVSTLVFSYIFMNNHGTEVKQEALQLQCDDPRFDPEPRFVAVSFLRVKLPLGVNARECVCVCVTSRVYSCLMLGASGTQVLGPQPRGYSRIQQLVQMNN